MERTGPEDGNPWEPEREILIAYLDGTALREPRGPAGGEACRRRPVHSCAPPRTRSQSSPRPRVGSLRIPSLATLTHPQVPDGSQGGAEEPGPRGAPTPHLPVPSLQAGGGPAPSRTEGARTFHPDPGGRVLWGAVSRCTGLEGPGCTQMEGLCALDGWSWVYSMQGPGGAGGAGFKGLGDPWMEGARRTWTERAWAGRERGMDPPGWKGLGAAVLARGPRAPPRPRHPPGHALS